VREAGLGVEGEEPFDLALVELCARTKCRRVLRREEMDRQDGRADFRSKAHAALDAQPRLGVQAVDAHERAARPGYGRFGENDSVLALLPDDIDRPLKGSIVGDVIRREADLQPAPGTFREAVGQLVRLGCGLQQRDGG